MADASKKIERINTQPMIIVVMQPAPAPSFVIMGGGCTTITVGGRRRDMSAMMKAMTRIKTMASGDSEEAVMTASLFR
jgi:hypothetical protein